MSKEVRALEPQALWNHFADLNAVPRPSKKEERVIEFMRKFGEDLGLETLVDHIGNVIIKKPATEGMEDRETVVMQSHLDMVHQKNNDTEFDFETEGINMFVEEDWVKAKGTTLGADNGIGVATIMAVLASKDIAHPAIEALFTIDEETGMTGAMELKGGLLSGKIMLNLDTEDDDELTIGCAGGIDVTGSGTYKKKKVKKGHKAFSLKVRGLSGGHSGMDISKGLGNANKIMNRLLYGAAAHTNLRLSSIDGGGLRNAIPRESVAHFTVPKDQVEALEGFLNGQTTYLEAEHRSTDPKLEILLEEAEMPTSILPRSFQWNLLSVTYLVPNGIHRMSPDIPELVQTSNNLARVLVKDGKYSIKCLTRSSVDSEKYDLANGITAAFSLLGAHTETSGDYPGWTPKPGAEIVGIMSELYKKSFKGEAHVMACHAGLECGILGQNYPDMEMISFGPNIRGAHSPDEKVQISSVQKFWGFLLDTLQQIPAAN